MELHMDSDACRDARNQIQNAHSTISDQLNIISNRLESIVGSAWVAPGAEQFKNDFSDWRQQAIQALNRLEELSNNLQREIVEWENTGHNL